MQMRQNGWQTLAVTSPNKGAGKSTVSLNLAISFAMEVDYTALLVDADLRDPDLRHMLELAAGTRARGLPRGQGGARGPADPPQARQSRRPSRRRAGREHIRADALADDGRDDSRGAQSLSRPTDRLRRAADPLRCRHAGALVLHGRDDSARRGVQDPAGRYRALVRALAPLEPHGHRAQQVARVCRSPTPSRARRRDSSSAFSEPKASNRVRSVLRVQGQAVLAATAGGVHVPLASAPHGAGPADLRPAQPGHVLRRLRRHRHRQDDPDALSPEPARPARSRWAWSPA